MSDQTTAVRLALDAVPAVRGRLAIARRTWNRGDTVLVQLAAVPPACAPEPACDSTLIVWVSPEGRLVRRQWAIDVRQPTSPLPYVC